MTFSTCVSCVFMCGCCRCPFVETTTDIQVDINDISHSLRRASVSFCHVVVCSSWFSCACDFFIFQKFVSIYVWLKSGLVVTVLAYIVARRVRAELVFAELGTWRIPCELGTCGSQSQTRSQSQTQSQSVEIEDPAHRDPVVSSPGLHTRAQDHTPHQGRERQPNHRGPTRRRCWARTRPPPPGGRVEAPVRRARPPVVTPQARAQGGGVEELTFLTLRLLRGDPGASWRAGCPRLVHEQFQQDQSERLCRGRADLRTAGGDAEAK